MISQQMWLYIGWVIFTIFVIAIIAVSYAMYRDYQLTKNRQTSLPSLDVIASAEKKNIFVGDEGTETPAKASPIPSRRALRGARAASPAPASPAVSAKPSSFFDDDDDEEFTLTAGTD